MEPGTILVCTIVICFFFYVIIEVCQHCIPHEHYKHYVEYDTPI